MAFLSDVPQFFVACVRQMGIFGQDAAKPEGASAVPPPSAAGAAPAASEVKPGAEQVIICTLIFLLLNDTLFVVPDRMCLFLGTFSKFTFLSCTCSPHHAI